MRKNNMKIIKRKSEKKSYYPCIPKILGALSLIALKAPLFVVGVGAAESPWTSMPSPSEVHKEYLEYSGQEGVTGLDENIVQTDANDFDSLSLFLGVKGYCSKITIRNLDADVAEFIFRDDCIYRVVEISANNKVAKKVNYAYRNIVPKGCEDHPLSAGSFGFTEYLIDGTNYFPTKALDLKFYIHSDSPLKVDIQNCEGNWKVTGPESVKSKFKWDAKTNISFGK